MRDFIFSQYLKKKTCTSIVSSRCCCCLWCGFSRESEKERGIVSNPGSSSDGRPPRGWSICPEEQKRRLNSKRPWTSSRSRLDRNNMEDQKVRLCEGLILSENTTWQPSCTVKGGTQRECVPVSIDNIRMQLSTYQNHPFHPHQIHRKDTQLQQ